MRLVVPAIACADVLHPALDVFALLHEITNRRGGVEQRGTDQSRRKPFPNRNSRGWWNLARCAPTYIRFVAGRRSGVWKQPRAKRNRESHFAILYNRRLQRLPLPAVRIHLLLLEETRCSCELATPIGNRNDGSAPLTAAVSSRADEWSPPCCISWPHPARDNPACKGVPRHQPRHPRGPNPAHAWRCQLAREHRKDLAQQGGRCVSRG